LAVIWGFSFLLIKVAVRVFAPPQIAFVRVLLGFAVVGTIMALRGERLPPGRHLWMHLAVAALLMNVIPFTLLGFGEQRISSVDAGLWNAATPLLTLPATFWLIPAERPDRRRIAGVVAGFFGVLLLLGATPQLTGRTLAGQAMCLAAACSYGVGFPYSRRFLASSGLPPVALAGGQLCCATAALAAIVVPTTSMPAALSAQAVLSVGLLGAAGTGLAYILSFTIVQRAGATVGSTVTYVVPVCSTVAGVTLLGERLTAGDVVGAIVILAGAALARGRRGPPARRGGAVAQR
jgi:drug/metabolite transporter (DMT)-like permease